MLSSKTCTKMPLSSHALQERKKEVALADLGYWQKFFFLFYAEILHLTTNEFHGLKCKDQLFVREDLF